MTNPQRTERLTQIILTMARENITPDTITIWDAEDLAEILPNHGLHTITPHLTNVLEAADQHLHYDAEWDENSRTADWEDAQCWLTIVHTTAAMIVDTDDAAIAA